MGLSEDYSIEWGGDIGTLNSSVNSAGSSKFESYNIADIALSTVAIGIES